MSLEPRPYRPPMTFTPVLPALARASDHVHVQGLALGAGLLGAVQNCDGLGGGGNGLQQLFRHEGPVQADLHKTDLFALGIQVVDDFLCHIANGAHGHDDPLGIGGAVVVEELVVGAQLGVDLVHVLLHHGGQRVVVLVAGLAVLEEDVAILVRAAHGGALRVQAVLTEGLHGVHVAHFLQVTVVPDGDLLDLMGGPEAVEEVNKGNAALNGGQVSHRRSGP